jgi:hypothetical protein
MDTWGADGCREHRGEIVDWMQTAAESKGWAAKMAAGWKMLGESWFNPLDPFGSLVDEAIRRASIANN